MDSISELTCRVCLHERQILINVFDKLDDLQTNLCTLLEKCGDIQIDENDNFPKYLCEECTQELLIAAQFREKCTNSKKLFDEALRAYKKDSTEDSPADNFDHIIEYSDEGNDFIAEEKTNTDTFTTDAEVEDNQDEDLPNVTYIPISRVQSFEENFVHTHTTKLESPSTQITTTSPTSVNVDDISVSDIIEETSNSSIQAVDVPTQSNVLNSDGSCEVDFEVHIDLSDSAFVKTMPLRAKREKALKCAICGAVFVQAINLQKHLQKTHSPDQCYICTTCNQWFSLETELLNHGKNCQETSKEIEICNANESLTNIYVNNSPMGSQKRCVYCQRDFQTPFALRMHMRSHTNDRPFSCLYCDKSFKTQSSLNNHTKRHTGQPDFECSVCGKCFYEKGNLDVHMRAHLGDKPHVCSKCNKSFTRVFLLNNHMRIHSNDRPYSCSYCQKTFRQRSDWKNHLRIHTGKQFSCSFCSKSYIKQSTLIQHIRVVHSSLQIELDELTTSATEGDQIENVSNFDDVIENEEEFPSGNI